MNLAESGFSREQEVEADDYGMDLAVRAKEKVMWVGKID